MKSALWYLLDKKDIQQKELAQAVGVSEACVSYTVNGKKLPSVAVLKKMADYIGIGIAELLEYLGVK